MRCDNHIHIVGQPEAYPLAPTRTYTPGLATLEQITALGAPHAITRFVIVQPSFYGTDNTLLLEGLSALGNSGRGVAVVDPTTVAPAQLQVMHENGVRGLRINLYSTLSGQTPRRLDDAFAAMAGIAARMRWHVEVIAPIAVLADAASTLAAAPVPVVIDHYGLHDGATPKSAAGTALLALLRHRHVWMKLSAPYRSGADPLALQGDPDWIAAFVQQAGDRCVWGSDWPHTPAHEKQTGHGVPLAYRSLTYAEVVDEFCRSLPDPRTLERVMVENPQRLYEF